MISFCVRHRFEGLVLLGGRPVFSRIISVRDIWRMGRRRDINAVRAYPEMRILTWNIDLTPSKA
jgi:hypothetical protein